MTVRDTTIIPSPGILTNPDKKRFGTGNLLAILFIAGISCALIAIVPASAGTQYMAGSPELSAYISGNNELSPGTEVQLPLVIQNSGVNQFKFVKSTIVDRDDLPNTAKFLTVGLGAGSSPLIVKSDPQMLGDLTVSGTATATASFTVRVPTDAKAGTYLLPVQLSYSYLYNAEQYGDDTIEYRYKTINSTLQIPVTIKKNVNIEVISTNVSDLNAGTEGYITLVVKNVGHEDGRKAILVIEQNGKSPIIPTEGSTYIGDFLVNATATGLFKTSVASSAEAQTYPLNVKVKYENSEGDQVTSDTETIGIPVGGKIQFAIISAPQTTTPGQKNVITATFKNTGDATAYQAVGRISMVDPFSSNDDSAFLGDLAPGETRDASFLVTTDASATPKLYGIDSEVRFRDALDNNVISDPLKMDVNVVAGKSIVSSLMDNPLLLAVLAVLVIAIGYFLYRRKKSQ
jgi:hypothetical protein